MTYRIEVLRAAEKSLRSLDKPARERIEKAIDALAENPRPPGCKKLVNSPAWRIRIGDYRVMYEIHDSVLVVTVIEVGHRREVYR